MAGSQTFPLSPYAAYPTCCPALVDASAAGLTSKVEVCGFHTSIQVTAVYQRDPQVAAA